VPGASTPSEIKRRLGEHARTLGFDMLRVAPADAAIRERQRLHKWLSHGYAGDMWYLERDPDARCNPASLLPGCRSVIVTATSYYYDQPDWPGERGAKIARYAWGADYHDVLRPRLKALGEFLDALAPGGRWKPTVDTSPLLEKALAAAAGIGWQGKHSLILNRELGSYMFLGLLLTTVELPPDGPEADGCQGCKACLDVCPSGALVAPRVLAANKCISYLTTERREAPEPGSDLSGWLYGCDLCQQACPYNESPRPSREPAFAPRPATLEITARSAADLTAGQFEGDYAQSPIARRRHDRFTTQARRLLEARDIAVK
jgi:epoxyqueuosine reductase